MKIFTCCLTVLFVTSVLGAGNVSTPNSTTVTPASTTQTPTTSSTTPKPQTTTAPSTTSSTTPKPQTTTAPSTTSTTAKSDDSKWIVKGPNGTICVMADKMEIKFDIMFKNSTKPVSIPVSVPTNEVSVTGSCDKTNAEMKLVWLTNNSIILHFMNYSKKYNLHHMNIELAPGNFITINKTNAVQFISEKAQANLTLGNSYKCRSLKGLKLNTTDPDVIEAKMELDNLKFQAFKFENSTEYGAEINCLMETSDIVPIAVGCVLAGLVVIVLVAYLISRRRSQNRGYLSM